MLNIIKSTTVRRRISLQLFGLIFVILLSTNSLAQQPAAEAGSWQFGASIYGWFPSISGETSFSPDGSNSEFEIDFDDILDSLQFALMGTFDVRKGSWGIFTDVIYMDAANSKSASAEGSVGDTQIPVNANADLDLDLTTWVWTLTGYYRALDLNGTTLDVVAGTRYLDVDQKMKWEFSGNVGQIPLSERTGDVKADLSHWDLIFGVKGRFAFGSQKSWFLPYYLDIGFGDSNLTWQGVAGLGYSFRWIEILAAWRYLYYDMPSDSFVNRMSFGGPVAGIAFRW